MFYLTNNNRILNYVCIAEDVNIDITFTFLYSFYKQKIILNHRSKQTQINLYHQNYSFHFE